MTSESLSALRPNSGIQKIYFVAEVGVLSEDGKEHSDWLSSFTICKTNRHKNHILMQDGLTLIYPTLFPDSFYCFNFFASNKQLNFLLAFEKGARFLDCRCSCNCWYICMSAFHKAARNRHPTTFPFWAVSHFCAILNNYYVIRRNA